MADIITETGLRPRLSHFYNCTMILVEDKLVKFPVPFLKDKTILYVDSRTGTTHEFIETYYHHIHSLFLESGYTFAFLPDVLANITPDMREYMFPGQRDYVFAEDMYQRIQDIAGLNDKTGFLYKHGSNIYFRELPEEHTNTAINAAINEFLDFLPVSAKEESSGIHFSRSFSKRPPVEEPLDSRAQAIIAAWEKIEREFGVTLQDVEVLLGYKVKLSQLHITTSGAILLPDYEGKEAKMDDLTKAIYFFYLQHPEGVCVKELQSHEEEILGYYMSITGRTHAWLCRRSVHNHLDPFGNNINVSLSRIKKAFKDIVGDKIAKFYYVDGTYAEPRKIALDRNLVIWDH